MAKVSADTVVFDAPLHFPQRDNGIAAIEAGQAESCGLIGAESCAHRNKPAGGADRVLLPVATDSAREPDLAMALVEYTGFDAVDAGPLAESWRRQPGTPPTARLSPVRTRCHNATAVQYRTARSAYRTENSREIRVSAGQNVSAGWNWWGGWDSNPKA
ncbi:hypothetical protein QFZ58_005029 [Streptomyces sp. B1I3]|nr:hypothetical protein [Streptomyces sp. B1I3]